MTIIHDDNMRHYTKRYKKNEMKIENPFKLMVGVDKSVVYQGVDVLRN